MDDIVDIYIARVVMIDRLEDKAHSLKEFMRDMLDEDPDNIHAPNYFERVAVLRSIGNEIDNLVRMNAEDRLEMYTDRS